MEKKIPRKISLEKFVVYLLTLFTASVLRMLWKQWTPRLRRWPLLHSAALLWGVKHPHTPSHTHAQWSNLTPHHPPAQWHRVDKDKQKTHILQVLQTGQGLSTPCVDSWNKSRLKFHQDEQTRREWDDKTRVSPPSKELLEHCAEYSARGPTDQSGAAV